jgi:hypothetical protein
LPHSRPRSKIHDRVKGGLIATRPDEKGFDSLSVTNVDLMKLEILVTPDLCQTPVFQPDVVRIIEVVDPNNFVPLLQEHGSCS